MPRGASGTTRTLTESETVHMAWLGPSYSFSIVIGESFDVVYKS